MTILKNTRSILPCTNFDSAGNLVAIENGALVWEEEKICWIGKESEIPKQYLNHEIIDAAGAVVTPGLIDCHTHLAFGGWREDEFRERCRGASYLDILKSGGGILSTVQDTRAASEEELFQKAHSILKEIAKLGVSTIECKSGYGLDLENELKVLKVYKRLNQCGPLRVVPTFLGAHTIPPEFNDKPDDYVDLLVTEMLPEVAHHKLATFCDIFVEDGAFSVKQAEKILSRAVELGFRLKLHVDQLSNGSGAELAAQYGAISADHLEHVSKKGLKALAKAGTVAVALPFASLYLKEKPFDANRAVENGVRVALATDFNPGSAPSYHLPFAMSLGCILNGLTPSAALMAVTQNGACAIGLQGEIGTLEVGKRADFALFDIKSIDRWLYNLSANRCTGLFKDGVSII